MGRKRKVPSSLQLNPWVDSFDEYSEDEITPPPPRNIALNVNSQSLLRQDLSPTPSIPLSSESSDHASNKRRRPGTPSSESDAASIVEGVSGSSVQSTPSICQNSGTGDNDHDPTSFGSRDVSDLDDGGDLEDLERHTNEDDLEGHTDEDDLGSSEDTDLDKDSLGSSEDQSGHTDLDEDNLGSSEDQSGHTDQVEDNHGSSLGSSEDLAGDTDRDEDNLGSTHDVEGDGDGQDGDDSDSSDSGSDIDSWEGDEAEEEPETEYDKLYRIITEKWQLIEVNHNVSKAATNEFWEVAVRLIPTLIEMKKNTVTRKIPQFVHIRRMMAKKLLPKINHSVAYRHEGSQVVHEVQDDDDEEEKIYKTASYTKLYETASVKVNIIPIYLEYSLTDSG